MTPEQEEEVEKKGVTEMSLHECRKEFGGSRNSNIMANIKTAMIEQFDEWVKTMKGLRRCCEGGGSTTFGEGVNEKGYGDVEEEIR